MAEQLSDREGAVDAYRKILAVDPEDPQALRLLGKLLGAAERWEELVDVLGRELLVEPRVLDRRCCHVRERRHEVEVTLESGDQVDVQLDKSFDVVGSESDGQGDEDD